MCRNPRVSTSAEKSRAIAVSPSKEPTLYCVAVKELELNYSDKEIHCYIHIETIIYPLVTIRPCSGNLRPMP